ncbi:hypothetical protein HXX76_009459 [Chlamydomonas incerta]|uniref:Cyclin-like domain-containing protein n=1 Tax=Chlamydomonas incerta TaxID=51695 RepID=A0A835VZJ1_CHLIN|nr:hypothetical protein HXX76_009459 [Chlamydomonas incerta]|eukprot:KAG2431444.1 hypothetical protein HXX76_009459 [Chlamydomonas incerta]
MSTLPSEDGIREMIRQELFAEQEARREAACCAAGGTEAHPPAVWAEHRRVLCEWTLALCRAAGMTRETFCLAASLLDRYVTECCAAMGDKGYPSEGTLQLLAMTCLSLAMKYEEVAPLHSADLLRLAIDPCTGALLYTAADLARMEWLVLQMLSWRVRMPTAASFLTLLLPACGAASAASSSLADVPCRDGSAHAHVSAGELLVHWATRLLDMCVLLAHQLPHQASTIAMACLLIAERLSSANAAATQRILQFWRELLPNVGQQQQQLQQVQQCARAVEAMWCAAHGDCTHLFSYQLQYVTAAVSQAAAPAPAPAMST